MFFAFFQPAAHLLANDARVDSVAARFEDFCGDLAQQVAIPALDAGAAAGDFRQAAAEDFQRIHEGQFARSDAVSAASHINLRIT